MAKATSFCARREHVWQTPLLRKLIHLRSRMYYLYSK
jgi:hypothetical protein